MSPLPGVISDLVEIALPPSCLACHAPLGPRPRGRRAEATALLCPDCVAMLRPWDGAGTCTRCGVRPFHAAAGVEPGFCDECHPLPRSFVGAFSAFWYDSPAGAMIRSLKYQHATHTAPWLAELACHAAADRLAALPTGLHVAAVPMSTWRELRRGYNQAALLAAEVASRLGRPLLAPAALRRIRHSGPQARSGDRGHRVANLRDAFAAPDDAFIRGRDFLLVDDVMTSGATMAFAADALCRAGANSVTLFSIARAALAVRGDEELESVLA